MAKKTRAITAANGVQWSVEVPIEAVGASNAMLLFHHPSGRTARLDRYAWVNVDTADARNVTTRLDPERVLESLNDERLAQLFRRSMTVDRSASDPSLADHTAAAVEQGGGNA